MPLPSARRGSLLATCSVLVLLAGCAPVTTQAPAAPGAAAHASPEERRAAQFESYGRMADSARAGGDAAAAANFYRQAISAQPENADGYIRLGEALVELGAHEEAAQAFRDALRFRPQDLAARRGYGRALVGLNRPDAAIAHYEAVLAVDPQDVRAINGLGVALDLAGRHDEAQDSYRRGLAIAPDSSQLLNNYGLSQALAGQPEMGIQTLRQVADGPAANARYRQNLALAYGLAGNMSAAATVARLDLDEQTVENNLRYYATLRAVGDGRRQAAAIGAHRPDAPEGAPAREASRRLQVVALEGAGLELGLAPGGGWFLDLGRHASSAAAVAAWRQLRGRHGDLLGSLSRLAGAQEGPQPLLVGPIADGDAARQSCRSLEARGQACRAIAL